MAVNQCFVSANQSISSAKSDKAAYTWNVIPYIGACVQTKRYPNASAMKFSNRWIPLTKARVMTS